MKIFVFTGTFVLSVIALVVIIAAVVFPIIWPNLAFPATLENWGGLIIGFYFGSFASLVRDWAGLSRGDGLGAASSGTRSTKATGKEP